MILGGGVLAEMAEQSLVGGGGVVSGLVAASSSRTIWGMYFNLGVNWQRGRECSTPIFNTQGGGAPGKGKKTWSKNF